VHKSNKQIVIKATVGIFNHLNPKILTYTCPDRIWANFITPLSFAIICIKAKHKISNGKLQSKNKYCKIIAKLKMKIKLISLYSQVLIN